MFRRKKCITRDEEEVRLDESVRVDGGNKSHMIIKFHHFHILFNGVGDIRTFYLSFTRNICRMYDINNLNR